MAPSSASSRTQQHALCALPLPAPAPTPRGPSRVTDLQLHIAPAHMLLAGIHLGDSRDCTAGQAWVGISSRQPASGGGAERLESCAPGCLLASSAPAGPAPLHATPPHATAGSRVRQPCRARLGAPSIHSTSSWSPGERRSRRRSKRGPGEWVRGVGGPGEVSWRAALARVAAQRRLPRQAAPAGVGGQWIARQDGAGAVPADRARAHLAPASDVVRARLAVAFREQLPQAALHVRQHRLIAPLLVLGHGLRASQIEGERECVANSKCVGKNGSMCVQQRRHQG